MKKVMILALLLALLCPALAEEAGTASEDYAPLYPYAEACGFKLGGAFGIWDMGNQAYMDFLARHFDSLTCTNETKAYSLLDEAASRAAEDGMPRMNYAMADRMLSWCAEHDIGVRGHVLVWDAYMTDWFFHEGYDAQKPYADRDTVRARIASYIDQVIAHFEEYFPGQIYCWDVVNEAIADGANEWVPDDPRHLRSSRGGTPNLFLEHAGDDYVEYAFLCARNTVDRLGADIKLFYNDYNLFMAEKRAAALELVDSIQRYATDDAGAPRSLIDGIGMQGYLGGYGEQQGCLDPALLTQLSDSIREYSEKGLQVQITEMAVRNFDQSKAAEHAEFYARLFTDVFVPADAGADKPLTAVCIWGITDAPTNDPNNYVYKLNSPYGGLLTLQGKIKTSFDAMYRALEAAAHQEG